MYTSRKTLLFNQLASVGCSLPSDAKGYILIRDAKISSSAWDTVVQWTKGSYDFDELRSALRRLERPLPGQGARTTHLAAFTEYDSGEATSSSCTLCALCESALDDEPEAECDPDFYDSILKPEDFDELPITEENLEYELHDNDIIFLPSNQDPQLLQEEHQVYQAYANYQMVRKSLHKLSLIHISEPTRPY